MYMKYVKFQVTMASTKNDSFFKIYCKESMYSMFKDKLQNYKIWINIYTMTQVKQKWI